MLLWIATFLLAIALIIALMVLARERTTHSQIVQRLEESRDRRKRKALNYNLKLRAVSETSGAAIVMVDTLGTVVHANTTAEEMFDIAEGEMVGRPLIQCTLSNDLVQFALETAKRGKKACRDLAMPGPGPRILRVSVFVFEVGLSGKKEVLLVIVDITELRRLETIRRDFVANVSHELRTPLTSIRAMAETLQDGAMDNKEVADRFLETIIRESDRLTRISEDLLVLADATSNAPDKEDFELATLINLVLDRLRPMAKERQVVLEAHLLGHIPVRANQDQIDQVLSNLVDNAIKYTSPGGKVFVEAKIEPDTIAVFVRDTGIGILEEDLPRIFERFYRVDKARSRASGGTGLGLSIVKNVIEAHGGEVTVASEFNHGSTFGFTLPKVTS
ncbi:MAG: PAS domain S-box protein [Chthonomonadaceae bacterium]|nr:PAS domain S-box protein [Chthonomonadaceae bacterium]